MAICRTCNHEFHEEEARPIVSADDKILGTSCPRCGAGYSQRCVCRYCDRPFVWRAGTRNPAWSTQHCGKGCPKAPEIFTERPGDLEPVRQARGRR